MASSASEIPELEAQVSKVAMRINSTYSTLTHSPLVLLQNDISYSQFLALLSVAEIYMATNLREGMNLTSHDFIHCQDGQLVSQKHGSLILSEFTGSASIFHGYELIVNPWDYKQCADAINTALEMSPEQKQRNWQFLLDRKSPHTATAWYSSLKAALTEAHSMQQSRDTNTVAPLCLSTLDESYQATQRRLFFLEDGALFTTSPSYPSSEATDLLQALILDSKNTIYLTSNRSPDQLDETVQYLPPQIGLIAENGCFAKSSLPLHSTSISPGTWEALVDFDATRDWRAGIRKVIEYFQERTEGSTIEERRCSLTFDYADALDPDVAARQASELADQINGARGSESIRVVRDATAVSIEPMQASKAAAALMLLNRIPAGDYPDFIFVAGGARGDETLFRWANRLNLDRNGTGDANANGERDIDLPAETKPRTVTTVTTGTHATEASAVLPAGWSLLDVLGLLVVPQDAEVCERSKSFDSGFH